jgi:UDP-N-acetylglucosamine--N-acetylmuramyl-(pentapeptide) pyrophosphoryl-undecaprenol N-acetylglucosamine transferase
MAEPQFAERPELRGRYMLRGYLSTRMAEALVASDVLLCRSGAATLAELAVLGRPSVLVPLPPGFTGSPQATNAAMFRQAGAAEVILDKDLNVDTLLSALVPVLESPPRRTLMANAARTMGQPEATMTLSIMVAELAQKRMEKLAQREGRQVKPQPNR